MTTLQKIAVGVVAILAVLGAIGFFRTMGGTSFGATTPSGFQQGQVQNNPMIFVNGFSAGSSQQYVVDGSGNFAAGDATFNGGTVNVISSNSATSTVVAGCFQFYATSTATALKFQASTTPGIMYSQYGTCPNL